MNKEQKYYLAIDIGASSGRHIIGYIEDGVLKTEEIYRFENSIISNKGNLCWDINRLFDEIVIGMKKCKEVDKVPTFMGIDTWAVDYVLLDESDNIIEYPYSYRDTRTKNIEKEVYDRINENVLYEKTGIQKQVFNTCFQLMAHFKEDETIKNKAKDFLMIPDYFNFLLTGQKYNEYTNATSTSLVNAETHEWDEHIIKALDFPRKMFKEIKKTGSLIGEIKKEIVKKIGFECKVIATASHDTASAVVAVPAKAEDYIYISSGTWSLIGTENNNPNISDESRSLNFTNEGGYAYKYRFLKNIMGLWMIQSIKKEYPDELSYKELCDKAKYEEIESIINCNDERFLAPKSMSKEVISYCQETNQKVPTNIYEMSKVIYASLANCYKEAVDEIEKLNKKTYETIHIVGGGSNADYLNELTSKATKKTILAGPSEATAIGNLLVQMISQKEFIDIKQARNILRKSISIKKY